MVSLKFDCKIELKMSILTIDHEANSRFTSMAMVRLFKPLTMGQIHGAMVMVTAFPLNLTEPF